MIARTALINREGDRYLAELMWMYIIRCMAISAAPAASTPNATITSIRDPHERGITGTGPRLQETIETDVKEETTLRRQCFQVLGSMEHPPINPVSTNAQ